jgi:cytoskeletal protein CcmA (bactofilin family)
VTAGEANAYIGPGLSLRGALLGAGDVRIEGKLEGDIAIEGVLTVGPNAHVQATVEADAVSVAGEIVGRVRARTLVEVHAGGRIDGDVTAPDVTIDQGGEVSGLVERTGVSDDAESAAPSFRVPSIGRARALRRSHSSDR